MKANAVLVALMAMLLTCGMMGCPTPPPGEATPGEPTEPVSEEPVTIVFATTTSFDNTGLLGNILPIFTEKTGIEVDVVAVGTGAALELARDGNADIVLVHAKEAEEEFIAEGHGVARHYVAQNEFVIVGPEDDPADLAAVTSAAEAFSNIMGAEATFVSRGDNSGTHKRELQIWDEMGTTPEGGWYVEAGQGMGAVLTMANEMEAYTLIDTGTFYSMEDNVDLVILFSGDPILANIYSIIPLNPETHPDALLEEADLLVEWFISAEVGELINAFRVNGHILFQVNEGGYRE